MGLGVGKKKCSSSQKPGCPTKNAEKRPERDTDVDAGVDTKVAEVAEGGTATGAAEEEKGASLGNRA